LRLTTPRQGGDNRKKVKFFVRILRPISICHGETSVRTETGPLSGGQAASRRIPGPIREARLVRADGKSIFELSMSFTILFMKEVRDHAAVL